MPETERGRPKKPGLAVLIVLLYGLLFLAGLLLLRARSPLFHKKPQPSATPGGTGGVNPSPTTRGALHGQEFGFLFSGRMGRLGSET
jgi:hypothetical protein